MRGDLTDEEWGHREVVARRAWARLPPFKQFRGIATCYDKTAKCR